MNNTTSESDIGRTQNSKEKGRENLGTEGSDQNLDLKIKKLNTT